MTYNVCMDTMTINISMPKGLYAQAKARAKKYHYSSVSEVIRDALRWWMNDNLTRNGFTPEFEDMVLKAENSPVKDDIVWEGKESDLVNYVKSAKKPNLHSKSKRTSGRPARVSRGSGLAGAMV